MDWLAGAFRDCNGVSNGKGLPDDVIKLEAVFASIALANPSIGPVGPIIIGGNGPIGGAGGSGGSAGTAAPWETENDLYAVPSEDYDAVVREASGDTDIALGDGGGGGDGGDGGHGGTGGDGGNGGRGGNGGLNGGNAGNGGHGGNGGEGGNGGHGGDGGDATGSVPLEYDVVEDVTSYDSKSGQALSTSSQVKASAVVDLVTGRGGTGGNGGAGGAAAGTNPGSKGGNGGNGGSGVIGGDGGNGGSGGAGGVGAAGGDGGDGGDGGNSTGADTRTTSAPTGKPRKKKQGLFWPKLRKRVLRPAIRRQTTPQPTTPLSTPLWRFPALPEPSQTLGQQLASLPLSDFTY